MKPVIIGNNANAVFWNTPIKPKAVPINFYGTTAGTEGITTEE